MGFNSRNEVKRRGQIDDQRGRIVVKKKSRGHRGRTQTQREFERYCEHIGEHVFFRRVYDEIVSTDCPDYVRNGGMCVCKYFRNFSKDLSAEDRIGNC